MSSQPPTTCLSIRWAVSHSRRFATSLISGMTGRFGLLPAKDMHRPPFSIVVFTEGKARCFARSSSKACGTKWECMSTIMALPARLWLVIPHRSENEVAAQRHRRIKFIPSRFEDTGPDR